MSYSNRFDEALDRESPEIAHCIEKICERAGTSDASWSVLKAAGELLCQAYQSPDPNFWKPVL